ncbi:PPE domain-containing protein [Actinokineospora soli]|uniref:PPE domain-containing protein n=1 Tax=Actinokineospora soli TaxID=1048753 RepID=A0ABW2TYW5_9PSEU
MTEDTTRWRGFSHEELYRMLHDGPGAPSSATPSRRWAELTAALDDVGHQLDTALGAVGEGWRGRAAGAAHGKLQPLAAWAKTTSESAASMRTAVETQGDLIAKARADMPVPEGVTPMNVDPSAPPAVQVVGVQTDVEPAETAKAAGEQRAVEVMTAYETGTKQNLAALAPFSPPGELLRTTGVRRGRGRGIRFGVDVPAGEVGAQGGGRDGEHPRHGHRPGEPARPHLDTTGGSSASAATAAPQRPLPALAPGMTAGAAPMEHIGPGPVALGAPAGPTGRASAASPRPATRSARAPRSPTSPARPPTPSRPAPRRRTARRAPPSARPARRSAPRTRWPPAASARRRSGRPSGSPTPPTPPRRAWSAAATATSARPSR